jgi:hypothetical protein
MGVSFHNQSKEEDSLEGIAEKIIKLGLFFILVLACFLYWLLPKTRLAKHFKMNEKVFVMTFMISIICCLIGLVVTFLWPQAIFEMHLWELLLMPVFLVYVYWFMVKKLTKGSEIVDEKQEFDMAKGTALSTSLTVPSMALLFVLFDEGILEGLIWFPYYLFVTLLFFSVGTLYSYKKS